MSEHEEHKNTEEAEATEEATREEQPGPQPRAVGIIGDKVRAPMASSSGGFGILTLIFVGIIGALAGGLVTWAAWNPQLVEKESEVEALQASVDTAVENFAQVGAVAVNNAVTAVEQRNFAVAEDYAKLARESMVLASGISDIQGYITKTTKSLDAALDALARNDAASVGLLEKARKEIRGIGRSAGQAESGSEKAVSVDEEAVSVDEEAVSVDEEAAPADEEAAATDEEAAPADEAAVDEKTAPADETAAEEEAAPADEADAAATDEEPAAE